MRHWTARWGLRLALLAVLGILGWALGLHVGRVPGSNKPAAAAATPSPALPSGASPSTTGPQPLDLTDAVKDFDPQGNGTEDPSGVGLAVDGDPSTGWKTELYYDSPTFGGAKKGVGLLVDLGASKSIKQVTLALSGNGTTDVQLLAAPQAVVAPTGLDGFDVLATTSGTDAATLTPPRPLSSRFWLVWLTRLPLATSGGGWQGEIDEMSFLPG